MTAFLIFILVVPIKKLHDSRKELLYTFGNWWITPFGRTKFRDAFFASCMLTLKVMLVDFTWLVCLYTSGSILNSTNQKCLAWRP